MTNVKGERGRDNVPRWSYFGCNRWIALLSPTQKAIRVSDGYRRTHNKCWEKKYLSYSMLLIPIPFNPDDLNICNQIIKISLSNSTSPVLDVFLMIISLRAELRYCNIGTVPTVPMLKMGYMDNY
jgi:hypothetical protein